MNMKDKIDEIAMKAVEDLGVYCNSVSIFVSVQEENKMLSGKTYNGGDDSPFLVWINSFVARAVVEATFQANQELKWLRNELDSHINQLQELKSGKHKTN